jgi:type VI secretion system protein ImpK
MVSMRPGHTTRQQLAPNPNPRIENLAAIFQEAFTVIVRLRSGRLQVADAGDFRRQFLQVLKTGEIAGRDRNYSDPAIHLAILALVAFLDESVLNLQQRGFTDWRGNSLQLQLYGDDLAGERFFDNLRKLRAQPDNDELADVLEVFCLCLLLGYRGKYGVTSGGDLNGLCSELQKRIASIRQSPMVLAPMGGLPRGSFSSARPSSSRGLHSLAGILLIVTMILFFAFKLSLRSSVADLGSTSLETTK